ncbi:hypothetical protein V8C35DRAFT_290389 [Trichoderma chlorosporum]
MGPPTCYEYLQLGTGRAKLSSLTFHAAKRESMLTGASYPGCLERHRHCPATGMEEQALCKISDRDPTAMGSQKWTHHSSSLSFPELSGREASQAVKVRCWLKRPAPRLIAIRLVQWKSQTLLPFC